MYRILSPEGVLVTIPDELLLDGRLKKYDVEAETVELEPSDYNITHLSGVDGHLCALQDATGECDEFFDRGSVPPSIVAALEKEFNVEIVNEDDPRFWGLATKQELIAELKDSYDKYGLGSASHSNDLETEKAAVAQRIKLLDAARATSDKTATGSRRRSISSRVSRTLGLVDDQIEQELLDTLITELLPQATPRWRT